MGFRQIFGGCTPQKILTHGFHSNIWGVYTPKRFDGWGSIKYLGAVHPKIFDGWGSVKYLRAVHPQNISRMWFREIFWGCTAPKCLTDGVPSNIWGLYTPKIFHVWGSVKYLGAVHPKNI